MGLICLGVLVSLVALGVIIGVIFSLKSSFNTNSSSTSSPKDLIHYWSFDQSYSNSISDKKASQGFSFGLTKNRFNRSFSALSLNYGYLKLPPDVYFNTKFSITLWFKALSIDYSSCLLDFSQDENNLNIKLCLSRDTPYFTFILMKQSDWLRSVEKINANKWFHLAFTFSEVHFATMYLNGARVGQIV